MHKQSLLALIFVSVSLCFLGLINSTASADSEGMVISQVQIGDVSSSRLVELYNNSSSPIDITNWCVYRSSATDKTKDKLACFEDSNSAVRLIVAARSSVVLTAAQANLTSDLTFIKTLGGVTGGHVYLVDSLGVERDRLGWGTAEKAEVTAAVVTSDNLSRVLERKQSSPGIYIDTNNNSADFINSDLRAVYSIGNISEVIDACPNLPDIQVVLPVGYYRDLTGNCVVLPVDICPNIADLQAVMPVGFMKDEHGDCQADVCPNLNGLQTVLPDNMEYSGDNCVYHDVCLNITGVQAVLPPGYNLHDDGTCWLDLLPLNLTELLPNAVGSDIGNEFIEIYNPNSIDVVLDNYILKVGSDNPKTYHFSPGYRILAHKYVVFTDEELGFTLVNSSSQASLWSADNVLIDQTSAYTNPPDGWSWALIGGQWQYTNQVTKGSDNLAVVVEPVEVISELQACPAGQSRNPETNRCRSNAVTAASLTPCRDGQYRSEVTNRCRNIAADVSDLVPCAEGQERNPATNRCRSITAVLAATDLVPCKDGQERNPDTNRCRNVVSAMPAAAYKPDLSYVDNDNGIGYWSLIAVGAVAVIYGVWEWKTELGSGLRKVIKFRHLVK